MLTHLLRTANFRFFVDDSDCFAMIMGICSDNGYVQLLQEFQGDPEKMSQVVLLTSCNTIVNIQCLTYAIVRWPTVFRSTQISNKFSYGMAGPETKGVTPLEDIVRSANRSISVASGEKAIEPPSGPALRKYPSALRPSVPNRLSLLPGSSSVISASFSKTAISRVPNEQQRRKRQRPGRWQRHERDIKNEYHLDVATERGSQQVPAEAIDPFLQVQPSTDSSEDPDCQLVHVFDMPKELLQGAVANPSCFRRSLFTPANGILPCTGSVMRVVSAGMRIQPGLRPSAFNNHTPALNKTSVKAEEDRLLSGASVSSGSDKGLSALKDPFIHVPMPNRAQEARYDPDRFLYQQSARYLAYTQQYLQAIVSHARSNHHTTTKAVRRQLRPLIEIAEFMLTRLWLAQEIQRLEDEAIERQIRCSQPSTFRCGDAWGNDWYLYSSLSRALGHRIKPALTRQYNSTAKSRLAKMDWLVLADGSAWKAECSTTNATMPRLKALSEG